MIDPERISQADQRLRALADPIGGMLVNGFHFLALFAIGAATVWAALVTFTGMVAQGHGTIEDILLLFIYLELGAMVGIYFKTNHMPVRFLIYIAITALTRELIASTSIEHHTDMRILILTGGILLLTIAVLVLRFGSHRYPSLPTDLSASARSDGDPTDR